MANRDGRGRNMAPWTETCPSGHTSRPVGQWCPVQVPTEARRQPRQQPVHEQESDQRQPEPALHRGASCPPTKASIATRSATKDESGRSLEGERPIRSVELRGLEPLTPTLPGRHDRVCGGSLTFSKPPGLELWTPPNVGVRRRTASTATRTATTSTAPRRHAVEPTFERCPSGRP
jgi:hypothetical protein